MGALLIATITFVVVFGGAFLGMYVRSALPEGHLRDDVKDVVRLSTGLIGTIAALVLGLLIASAKSSYDAVDTQVKQITTKVILLDVLLEQYGPEARNLRVMLRGAIDPFADRIWNEGGHDKAAPFVASADAETFIKKLQELTPSNNSKHALQTQAINAIAGLAQARLSLFAQTHDSIPAPFLAILIFWLAVIFVSFGLFVRTSRIVIITFFVGALSVSAAIFLILEMDQPFSGLLQISSEPLRHSLAPLPP